MRYHALVEMAAGKSFNAEVVATNLVEWFRSNARQLPWREHPSPYRIWLAEMMLQQTTISAVVPYYLRFLERFPTVAVLAAASDEDVLRLWQGLGYYSRARNLLKAARAMVAEGRDGPPSEIHELLQLPGIGRYTAGAIRAIAHDRPAAMVDANVRRVIGRILALAVDDPEAESTVADASLLLSQSGQPSLVNQGLMELGSLICHVRMPDCGNCPVGSECAAAGLGSFQWFGSQPSRKEKTIVREVCALASLGDRWLVAPPLGDRWKGLWEFPRSEIANGESPEKAVDDMFASRFSASPHNTRCTGGIRYTVTRFSIRLEVVRCRLAKEPAAGQWRLETADGVGHLPMPSPMRRIARAYLTGDGARIALEE